MPSQASQRGGCFLCTSLKLSVLQPREPAMSNSPFPALPTDDSSHGVLIPAFYIWITKSNLWTFYSESQSAHLCLYGLVLEQPACHTYAQNRKQQCQVHLVLTGPCCIPGTGLGDAETGPTSKHHQVHPAVSPPGRLAEPSDCLFSQNSFGLLTNLNQVPARSKLSFNNLP